MRLTKSEYGCLMALCASFRSEDPKTQVGCAIENHNGRIISTGFNGLKTGCSFSEVSSNDTPRDQYKPLFIHAETNALSLISHNEGKILYCTHSPCMSCAQNIVAHGIQEVVCLQPYENCNEYKNIFDQYGIIFRLCTEKEKENLFSSVLSVFAGDIFKQTYK